MPRHTLFVVVTIGLGLLLLVGCGNEPDFGGEQPDGTVVHPIADSIPYYGQSHIPIDTSHSIDELEDPTEPIAALADYLDDPEAFGHQELDVFVNNAFDFHVTSVGEDRLVMLDTRENRLLEYNLGSDEGTQLADEGQGPGDVEYAEDMAREGRYIYVAMNFGRVARFDCEPVPCEFDREINLGFRIRSVAPVDDSTLAVLVAGFEEEKDDEFEEGPVRLVDREGRARRSLGTAYQSEHPLVRTRFTQDAMVRYSNTSDLFVIAYRDLPVLYAYDASGELRDTYGIEFFIPTFAEHNVERGSMSIDNRQGRSDVWNVIALDEEFHMVRVQTGEVNGEHRVDYYAVNFNEGQSYHVGRWNREEGYIFPTDLGFVLNDRGDLSFINY